MNDPSTAAIEFAFSGVEPGRIETLTDLLEAHGAVAVSVLTDPAERAFAEPGIATAALALPVAVRAHFPPDTDIEGTQAALAAALQPLPALTVNHLADTDWTAAAAARSGSVTIGDRVWIGPEYDAPPSAGLIEVSITPGLAFGTGEHPTTRLVAQALVENAERLRGAAVIDYGCGSAVLAIIAARLGAARVAAIDIDPVACDVARRNVAINDVANVEVRPVDAPPAWPADVLVANILLAPLVTLAPTFAGLMRDNGFLALAGILSDQVDECLAAYAPFFTMGSVRYDDEWALLSGQRNAVAAGPAEADACAHASDPDGGARHGDSPAGGPSSDLSSGPENGPQSGAEGD